MIRFGTVLLTIAITAFSAVGQTPPPASPETLESNKALAGFLKDLLLKNMPDPLVRNQRNWDQQKEVLVGLKWHRLKPEAQKSFRNNGLWHRLTVQALEPSKSLQVGITDVKTPQTGLTNFVALVGLDVRATAEQQLWKSGVRLYSGETRARAHVAVRLQCELMNKLERKPGQLIPDALVRVRVTKAELFYQDLVVEHTAGLDGEQARKVGDLAQNLIKMFKPDLERDLVTKANAAIVKAGDTKEVRIEFEKMLGLLKP
jgi:hypothetical protein